MYKMSIISLIIKREFIAKVRNKSFIVMTFLSPLLFVAVAATLSFAACKSQNKSESSVDSEAQAVEEVVPVPEEEGTAAVVDTTVQEVAE